MLYNPSYKSNQLGSFANYGNDKIGHSHGRGMISDTARAWSAKTNNKHQWWQIDVKKSDNKVVNGVAVKGRQGGSQYVTKCRFQYFDSKLPYTKIISNVECKTGDTNLGKFEIRNQPLQNFGFC